MIRSNTNRSKTHASCTKRKSHGINGKRDGSFGTFDTFDTFGQSGVLPENPLRSFDFEERWRAAQTKCLSSLALCRQINVCLRTYRYLATRSIESPLEPSWSHQAIRPQSCRKSNKIAQGAAAIFVCSATIDLISLNSKTKVVDRLKSYRLAQVSLK